MQRSDFKLIASCVKSGEQVLDLGCGDGELLAYLKEKKQVVARGIERATAPALRATAKGLSIIQGEIEWGLELFEDNFFDVIILSSTIQELPSPSQLLEKSARKGKRVVVSFRNYGYFLNRLQFLRGRTPQNAAFPQVWHKSPEFHPLTIEDFESYAEEAQLKVLERHFLRGDWRRELHFLPNLFAGYAVYVFSRETV